MDLAHRGPRQADGDGNVAKVVADQDQPAGLLGDVRPGADGEPDVRGRQCGGVVDAVAHHGHHLARVAQPLDLKGLVLGQDTGDDPLDSNLAGDGPSGALVIPGQHHDADAVALQLGDGVPGVALHGVRHRDDRSQLAVERKQHGGLAFFFEPQQRRLCVLGDEYGAVRHETAVTEQHLAALDPNTESAARDRLEALRGGELGAVHGGAVNDRSGEGVFAACLGGGGEAQHLGLGQLGACSQRRENNHIGDSGFAFRKGAGLVEHHGGELHRPLEVLGAADEDACLRALADPDHERGRGGDPERAGTGNDQHRDEGKDRLGQVPSHGPADEAGQRDEDDGGHEIGGNPVSDPLDLGRGRLGLLHQGDDLVERRLCPDPGRPELERTSGVEGAADYCVARALLDGDALTGQQLLVHRGGAVDDLTVGGDLLPGAHDDNVSQ